MDLLPGGGRGGTRTDRHHACRRRRFRLSGDLGQLHTRSAPVRGGAAHRAARWPCAASVDCQGQGPTGPSAAPQRPNRSPAAQNRPAGRPPRRDPAPARSRCAAGPGSGAGSRDPGLPALWPGHAKAGGPRRDAQWPALLGLHRFSKLPRRAGFASAGKPLNAPSPGRNGTGATGVGAGRSASWSEPRHTRRDGAATWRRSQPLHRCEARLQEQHPTKSKDPLDYPFETVPPRGTTLEVAPGVHWIRMPLPYALDHINLWALDDEAGWAIVDTGTRTDENAQVWRELFAHAPDQRGITRIFVTHMHPDHVGMAGWLTRKFNARFCNFGKHIHALPESFKRLRDGEIIRIGRHDGRVIVGTGHSPEHACLYCADLKVLISGDQVLPRISSNVSVHPTEPDADPMSEWMASIEKLRREVPDDVLVLPSHHEPFRGLHLRLDRLAEGQHKAFNRLRETLGAEPRRVVDVFGALFSRPIAESDTGLLGMATGETLACLNYLIARGEATRTLRDGVHWYALTPSTPD